MYPIKQLAMICSLVVGATSVAYGQTCTYGEAPSDSCPSARVIPGTPGQHVVLMDVHTATATPGEMSVYTTAGHTVWFSVTPAVSGPMTISTCHPNTMYDTVLEVYSGGDPSCGSMTFVDANDDTEAPECDNGCSWYGSVVTIEATAGEIYRFVVGSANNNSAGCPLCLGVIVTVGEPCGDAPTNLGCQLARELPGEPGAHEALVDVTDAFVLLDEPQPNCVTPDVGHTVWFSVTPAVNGPLTFSTCHPNTTYDTVVQAYVGDCTGMLAYWECGDDFFDPACSNACGDYLGTIVSFFADAGVEYYFQVGSYEANSSGCELCLGVNATIEDICEGEETAPVIEITSPPELGSGCACDVVSIEGAAYDDDPGNTFESYTLDYRRNGEPNWTTIAYSTEPVTTNGLLGEWDTSGLAEGYYLLRLTAENICGMASSTSMIVFLGKDFDNVDLRYPNSNGIVGRQVCLEGTVWDSWCFDSYTADYRPAGGGPWDPVNPTSPVYLTPIVNDPFASWDTVGLGLSDGDYELRVVGTNGCGNTREVIRGVIVDNTPPIAEITDPANCSYVEGVVPIIGTGDDLNLDNWALQYTGGGSNHWVTIANGTSPVLNNELASWDTTGLPACAYTLRLWVYDEAVLNCNSPIRQGSGYRVSVNVGSCGDFDVDDDGDVDLFDYAAFHAAFTGPL